MTFRASFAPPRDGRARPRRLSEPGERAANQAKGEGGDGRHAAERTTKALKEDDSKERNHE